MNPIKKHATGKYLTYIKHTPSLHKAHTKHMPSNAPSMHQTRTKHPPRTHEAKSIYLRME